MDLHVEEQIDISRRKLLDAIAGARDVTFLRAWGNIGDQLIYAGTRQLLSKIRYREIDVRKVDSCIGDTALLAGGGAWCRVYQDMPKYLEAAERRFAKVIVLPSSFDATVESVRSVLSKTGARVFARERVSWELIRKLCDADLAHDAAFFFDFGPYRRNGEGTLMAFRTDPEATGRRLPSENDDISETCDSLDAWLWTIARHDRVLTDRAHVVIAAAMLGKEVHYRPSNYHKLPAMVEFALQQFPVSLIEEGEEPDARVKPWASAPSVVGELTWDDAIRLSTDDLMKLLPSGATVIVADDNQLGQLFLSNRRSLPFVERQGQYWGPPADDVMAIDELERLRQAGAGWLVFAWPAFWWLEYYGAFERYLKARFRTALKNDRLVVFDLRSSGAD
jgi:exopolysaccharide biosynthesis predicted pyruvyltransferase EpsI